MLYSIYLDSYNETLNKDIPSDSGLVSELSTIITLLLLTLHCPSVCVCTSLNVRSTATSAATSGKQHLGHGLGRVMSIRHVHINNTKDIGYSCRTQTHDTLGSALKLSHITRASQLAEPEHAHRPDVFNVVVQ